MFISRSDIPEFVFSSIKEDDPYRASKLLQIEHWCYAHWNLHQRTIEIGQNFIAQVLSSEDCWEKVNNLHGVRLNRQMVGKKLITVPDSDNPFSRSIVKRYMIACECCLEEDIRAIFEEIKKELSAQDNSIFLEYEHLVRCCGEGLLAQFWSHFISGYLDKLDLRGRHPYEYLTVTHKYEVHEQVSILLLNQRDVSILSKEQKALALNHFSLLNSQLIEQSMKQLLL